MSHGSVRAVIIADDLTGAMDAAVPFARRGLKVAVITALDNIPADQDGTDVLSISTNSRHCSAEEAVGLVQKAFQKIAKFNPGVLIKKIDSTLRGHVVAESCALLLASKRFAGVICPAVPSQKRTITNGTLSIDGTPLADTAIGKDLRSKPQTDPLHVLFGNYAAGFLTRLEALGEYYDPPRSLEEQTISICDAVTNADIVSLVAHRKPTLTSTLFVGASGLTEALAQVLHGNAHPEKNVEHQKGSALFVIGSLTPETEGQFNELLGHRVDQEVVILKGADPITHTVVEKLQRRTDKVKTILLKAPERTGDEIYDSDKIVQALGKSALTIMSTCDIDLIVGTGGDTVQGLLQQLETKQITVLGEVEPGVVYGSIEAAGKHLWLVTKAGGFGEKELFLRILKFFAI